MAKQVKKEAEAVEVEVLNEETGIEKQINQEVKKYNLADAEIAKLKKKYAGLKVNGVEDKAGLKVVKEALADVVSRRTAIDKKRLSLTGGYRKIVEAINGEAKRLTGLIVEIEDPLRAEKERIDALIKEEKERKEKEEQEKLDNRIATLKEKGMVFDGSFYTIGASITMDIVSIKGLKDSDFDFLVAKVEMEAEKIRKAQEEEEKRKAAEEAERKRQQEELERQQAELRKQQEEMEAQRKEFERQQQELAEMKLKAEREEQERKERIAREEAERKAKELQDLVNHRASQLEAMDFHYSNSRKAYVFANKAGAHAIDEGLLKTSTPEYWTEILEEAKSAAKIINENEAEIIAQEKEAERQRILKEQAEAKAKAEAEEAARLAALPDVEKIENYLKRVLEVPIPEIANEQLRSTLATAVNNITQNASAVIESIRKFK